LLLNTLLIFYSLLICKKYLEKIRADNQNIHTAVSKAGEGLIIGSDTNLTGWCNTAQKQSSISAWSKGTQ